ncbi:MAG: CBS domain-containing protein [Deltaproteobacteria bacterium]|nr:MAG: CBS domain-containing protein [Deltaproteobacteria bacterium]
MHSSMIMLMPSISRYMTRQPWTIRRDALPVLEAGKLVGIVSDRDLHLIETLPDGDPDEVEVEDAMTEDVYAASPDDPVDAVVERMADHKYGSAVVMNRRGVVEGIFTTIDAMQVLADVLRRATA